MKPPTIRRSSWTTSGRAPKPRKDGGFKKDLLTAVLVIAGIATWVVVDGRRSSPSPAVDRTTLAQGDLADRLDREHQVVSFGLLSSFTYGDPVAPASVNPRGRAKVPDAILALNGRQVAIDGFMLPIDYDDGGVTRFLLNASFDMCQFGAPSAVNERVDVTMTDGRRTVFTHRPIRVYGQFEVGERREGGRLVSLYRMKGLALGAPGLGY
jgi:hypothetical protein